MLILLVAGVAGAVWMGRQKPKVGPPPLRPPLTGLRTPLPGGQPQDPGAIQRVPPPAFALGPRGGDTLTGTFGGQPITLQVPALGGTLAARFGTGVPFSHATRRENDASYVFTLVCAGSPAMLAQIRSVLYRLEGGQDITSTDRAGRFAITRRARGQLSAVITITFVDESVASTSYAVAAPSR